MRMSAACMPAAWYIAGMKKKLLTVTEFARMGGKARAQKLSAERRRIFVTDLHPDVLENFRQLPYMLNNSAITALFSDC